MFFGNVRYCKAYWKTLLTTTGKLLKANASRLHYTVYQRSAGVQKTMLFVSKWHCIGEPNVAPAFLK